MVKCSLLFLLINRQEFLNQFRIIGFYVVDLVYRKEIMQSGVLVSKNIQQVLPTCQPEIAVFIAEEVCFIQTKGHHLLCHHLSQRVLQIRQLFNCLNGTTVL